MRPLRGEPHNNCCWHRCAHKPLAYHQAYYAYRLIRSRHWGWNGFRCVLYQVVLYNSKLLLYRTTWLYLAAVSSEDCSRHIDSRQHRSGTFHSPNYPDSYPSDVVCQYTFQGHGRERVQINFTDVRLRRDVDQHGDSSKLVSMRYVHCVAYMAFRLVPIPMTLNDLERP